MTPERWKQIRDVLENAIEVEGDQRVALLARACSSDPSLRQQVEALLDSDENARTSFLQSPPLPEEALGDLHTTVSTGSLKEGAVFAERFRLIRKLGQGGMGQVWLADQLSPVKRQVALKLIKAGMYDESVVQRFQSERQSLAIMDHPAIAKVFDAGATPQGQPYFVMEFVPGSPITEYCDQKKLKINDRLELFIQVCEGVQHAHQKAIIHRDLKPANILVAEVDGKAVPRIIDFGLAKAITPLVDAENTFTQMGNLVGTPGYMSPEQANPDVRDIDTRTDVYSLGVVLYVLLAGSRPIDKKPGEKLSVDEQLRRVREEEPQSPSSRVSTDRETSSATAEARGIEPKQLVSLLRGDLDWITMKALDKDRARRYGGPSELAGDIRRYLNHEAVTARPASTSYRLGKYVRRHRVALGVAAGLVMVLAAFTILQAVQLRRITRERDRANRITDFMTTMFQVSDPGKARGNTVTAREILDKASNDIGKNLAQDPEVQSDMMQVMGHTYQNLGLLPRADELTRRALDARLRMLGPNNPKTLESMDQLGWISDREGRYDDAEKLERQALAKENRVLATDDALTLRTMDHLAVVLEQRGNYQEEERLEREVIDIGKRKLGPENLQVLSAMNHLGSALWNQARYADAVQQYRQLLEVEQRVLGPNHPQTVNVTENLALAVQAEGHPAEAEPLFRDALAGAERVYGHENPNTALHMDNLASLLVTENRLPEGESYTREALAIRLRILGPDHASTLISKLNLAEILGKEGHFSEAEKLQRETLATQIRVIGPEDPDTLLSQSDLASTLNKEGRYAEAEDLARKTFDVQLRKLGPQHPDAIDTLRHLGIALARTHRYAAASALFHDVITQQQNAGKGNPFSVWCSFAAVAAAAERQDDALQYLEEAVHRGYKDPDALMADDDLKNLHQNPKFTQLVAQLKAAPASAATP